MRLYPRSADRRPDPPPIPTNDRAIVLVGTAVWAVLLVAALIARDRLAGEGRTWWIWTALAGVLLGLNGLRYVARRDRRRRASERQASERQASERQAPPAPPHRPA